MKLVKILLFPVSLLYGMLVFWYHKLYDFGILPSRKFDVPVISVGNLTVGGTGKTPHVEYLIRLLHSHTIATLSRGYGRATSGFILANEASTAIEIGDEPRQFRHKFSQIQVAVDENRVRGIKKLLAQFSNLNVILLDDAFQHRAVKAGLSILLMDYRMLSSASWRMLLPTGVLREWKSGSKRADIIVVTNTPSMLSPLERRLTQKEIKIKPHQKLFFSYIEYGDFIPAFPLKEDKSLADNPGKSRMLGMNKNFYFERDYSILLVTGIANPSPLEEHLKENVEELIHLKFSDHCEYSMADIVKVQKIFDNIVNPNKIIVTTEKDAMRLAIPGLTKTLKKLAVFYIPIEVAFHNGDELEFNKQIIDYVKQNQRDNRLHSE